MNDYFYNHQSQRSLLPITIDVPNFPWMLTRRIERESIREERREEGAARALDTMPEHDKKRLRTKSNSDILVELEAAYRQAKRDLQLKLKKPSFEPEQLPHSRRAGFWELIFNLAKEAPSVRHAKDWCMILIHTETLRTRGKGEKTHKNLKHLFDHLVEKGFLAYDKRMRTYRIASYYYNAVKLMRELESSHIEKLLPQKKAKRFIRRR